MQRRWLHIRDACQEPIRDCLIALYQSHLAELSRTESPPPAFISKTDTYKSEAEKLTKILQVAGARTYVAMGVSTTSYCVRALHDLQSGSEMKAVEPEVRARSEDDPKLAKFHRCDRADQSNAEDLERAFLGFYMLGGVDVDGDRDNGLEDILYSGGQPTDKTGRPGYDWIDLDGCSFRGGAPLSAYARPWTIKPGQLLLNVLVAYRGDIVAIELVPAPAGRGDPGETKYDVWLTRLRAIEDEPRGCSWREEK